MPLASLKRSARLACPRSISTKYDPVIYSLGNLIFDSAPTVASWTAENLLEIGVAGGASPSLRFTPIRLECEWTVAPRGARAGFVG